MWFSDEAHFLLSGHVNSKNNIFWGSALPEHCLQRPLHSTLCTAWVALSKHGVIGPYWFEDDDEHAMTVSTERYLQILRKLWTDLGQRRSVVRAEQWFQQDGTTPHTSNDSLNRLRQLFHDRLISRRCDPEWVPHSPDLNPPDFYLWGYLKDNVYTNNPQTIPDLKAAIAAKIRAIPKEECRQIYPKLCTSGASVSAAWRSKSGTHLGASMKHTFFKVQTSNFAKTLCIDLNLCD